MSIDYIGVKQVGPPQFPRYVVVRGDSFWSGSDFVPIRQAALLYAHMKLAVEQRNTLVKAEMDAHDTEDEDQF